MKKILLPLLLLTPLLSFANHHAAIGSCKDLDSIGNMTTHYKSFSNGKIRLALVDTNEPACCSVHLLIFIPDPHMGYSCFAVNAGKHALGFSKIGFSKLKASYNPAKGLLIRFSVGKYSYATSTTKPAGSVKVRISLKGNGSVKLEN